MIIIDIQDYGYKFELNEENIARVTAVFRNRYQIYHKYGEGFAKLKTSKYYNNINKEILIPTVGDYVEIEYNESGDSNIINTLERTTVFSRPNPSTKRKTEQYVAANFDYVFILMSLNNDYNTKRLERYLTVAWQSGAIPVVVLTKQDVVEEYKGMLSEIKDISIGVEVFVISAKTGFGLNKLEKFLQPKQTIVFLGSSGVGKSTLVNALANSNIMKTSGIRKDDAKGRHTTTHRQLIKLDSGVMIIDTPGMRELGMGIISDGLKNSFKEIEDCINNCRFTNCSHTNEPGCEVLKAIEEGFITEERWRDYLKLKKEERYIEKKSALKLKKVKTNSKRHYKRSKIK